MGIAQLPDEPNQNVIIRLTGGDRLDSRAILLSDVRPIDVFVIEKRVCLVDGLSKSLEILHAFGR